MDNTISESIVERYKSILNEDLLEEIAKRLGSDWFSLSFYLELPFGVLDDLQESIRVPVTLKPFQMLKLWKKIRPNNDLEIEEICKALMNSHRRDLTDFIKKNTEGKNIIDNILMKNLSDHLVREWFTLGIYLGVSYADLTNINESIIPQCTQLPARTLLQKWKTFMSTFDEQTILQDFLKALINIKRNDLVVYIKSKLQ